MPGLAEAAIRTLRRRDKKGHKQTRARVPGKDTNKYLTWSREDHTMLLQLIDEGVNIERMKIALGRSSSAIYTYASKCGFSLIKGKVL